MHVIPVRAVDEWFVERLRHLECSAEASAYVAGVLRSMVRPKAGIELSDRSIVLAFRDAGVDFGQLQSIGDWVLWAETFAPGSISAREAVDAVAQEAYFRCFRLSRGQWAVYEELANDLPKIVVRTRLLFVT
jgi:hypothetical protein